MKTAVWVLLALTSVAFAGCTESGETEAVATDGDIAPEPIEAGLNVDSVVAAPEWQVGDYFGHHIFFGSEDTEGEHIDPSS